MTSQAAAALRDVGFEAWKAVARAIQRPQDVSYAPGVAAAWVKGACGSSGATGKQARAGMSVASAAVEGSRPGFGTLPKARQVSNASMTMLAREEFT
jgi:hypothetical protein